MPYTYILYSLKINKYYIGACADLKRRLYEHNIGRSKFTSTGIPWILKYFKIFETLREAKKSWNYDFIGKITMKVVSFPSSD